MGTAIRSRPTNNRIRTWRTGKSNAWTLPRTTDEAAAVVFPASGPPFVGGERCYLAVPSRFGTIKSWMGSTHFQMRTLKKVGTEMALHMLAYNLKRIMNILGIGPLIAAMRVDGLKD